MSVRHLPPTAWTGRSDPEDGEAALRLHHLVKPNADRGVIGFACEAGVARNLGRIGAAQGPAALRAAMANLSASVSAPAFSDFGDIVVEGDALEAGQTRLATEVAGALKSTQRLIVLGGGHETALGSYCGLRDAFPHSRIGIINLDAHLDLRHPSERGPSSGTPFWQIHALDPKAFDYLCIGVAEESNTQALIGRAREYGVRTVSDHTIIANPNAADAEITNMAKRNDVVYLTIDIDVMPHFQAPGVSAPAARGVPFAAVENLVQTVIEACKAYDAICPLADLVELSPPHDKDGMTAKSAAVLARRILFA